jgi:plasmid replication initiation protein
MKELDIKNHETIIQANELSRALYSCSTLGRKIIAFAATKISEKTINVTPFWSSSRMETYVPAAEFKISELLQALGLDKDNGKNYENIKKTVSSLRKCSLEIKKGDDEFKIWNWFQFIQYSKTKDKIELHFSHEIGWTLYGLKDSYTALNLKTIGNFKSFYALRFYEIALSWVGMKGRNGNKKGTWFFQMTPEEIRETFKIDEDSYTGRFGMSNFTKKVITIPIDEVNEVNKEFNISVTKILRGRTTVAFRFDCTETLKESKKLAIAKNDEKENKELKREINNEQEKIAELKEKHLDYWQKIYDFEIKQASLFDDEKTRRFFAENKANLALLQEFSN